MREKLQTWIKASVIKYFSEQLRAYGNIYLEAADDNKKTDYPRFEVRIDLGLITDHTRDHYDINVYVNILIITQRNINDIYDHDKKVGFVTAAFDADISIFKYTDDELYFNCLAPDDQTVITNYGELLATDIIIQTTVERSYRLTV